MATVTAGLAMAATPASAKASLEALSVGSRALVAAYGLAFYLVKTVLPVGLSPLYSFVTSVVNAREAVRLLSLPPPPELEACRGRG